MKTRIVVCFLAAMLFSPYLCVAQSADTSDMISSSARIFQFIQSVDDNLEALFAKEETKRIIRHLEYFENDLDEHLAARKEMMCYLDDTASMDYKKAGKMLNGLKHELKDLAKRLQKINRFVTASMPTTNNQETFTCLDKDKIAQHDDYLTELEKLINGQEVDLDQLATLGDVSYRDMKETYDLIPQILKKLSM
jgi:hypothetical protein